MFCKVEFYCFLLFTIITTQRAESFWIFPKLSQNQNGASYLNLTPILDAFSNSYQVTLNNIFGQTPRSPSSGSFNYWSNEQVNWCSESLRSYLQPHCLCDGPATYPIITCQWVQRSDIISSYISRISQSVFGRFTLYNSSLTSIDSNFLPVNKAFEHIRIMKVEVSNVTLYAFQGSLGSLKRLEIIHCNLSDFPFNEINSFRLLKDIDLRYNRLTMIPDYAFKSNSILETINLSFNDISYLGSYAFASLPNLKQLLLSYNRLKILNNFALATYSVNPSLMIDLSNNKLFHLSDGSFNGQTPRYLDLSFNSLTKLDETIFGSLVYRMGLDRERGVYVAGNKFQCKCETSKWLVSLNYQLKKAIKGFLCDDMDPPKTLDSLTLYDLQCST